jgi:hypothetical protein
VSAAIVVHTTATADPGSARPAAVDGEFPEVPLLTGTWDWEQAFYETTEGSPGTYGTGTGVLVITEQTGRVFTGYIQEAGDWEASYINGAVMDRYFSLTGIVDANGVIQSIYSNIPLMPDDDDYETGTFVARRRPPVQSRVAAHVSVIEISKSIEYYQSDPSRRHNIDVAVMVDDAVAAVSVVAPNGITYPLQYEGEGEFWTPIAFATAAQLAAFRAGDWLFSVSYQDGTSDVTTVTYAAPGGDAIELVMQEPEVTFPGAGQTDVPSSATFTWAPVTDEHANAIGLEWEPVAGPGLQGGIELAATHTQYGPVSLSPNTQYVLSLSFSHVYRGKNSDGIPYVIDADSEQERRFQTGP